MDTLAMEPYLPFEDVSLESLAHPLKGRSRIQYTCFTASNQFIMIGTNTGGVYVFNRISRQFVSILPGQAGGVACVAVDAAENLVAAGSVQGAVSVYACPTPRSWSGQLTALARLDSEVRALCWRTAHLTGRLVYVGTAAGKVLAVSISKKKTPASSTTITPMLQLDSAVCEMVLNGQTLLVSTLGFCYLCNVQMEVFAQVGSQPRGGRLGACFLGQKVFCARPGLRLWEVHLTGQVVSTHQLRPALQDATPRRIVSACHHAASVQDGVSAGGKTALGLVKLVPLAGGAVAAFSGDAVFVLDLAACRVQLWTSVHDKVRDLTAVGDELYVQCTGGVLRRLLARHPSQIVRELRADRGAVECVRFLLSHSQLSDLCRSPLSLDALRDALPELVDDEPMRAQVVRLAAVLKERLAEDGVVEEVGEKRSLASAGHGAARLAEEPNADVAGLAVGEDTPKVSCRPPEAPAAAAVGEAAAAEESSLESATESSSEEVRPAPNSQESVVGRPPPPSDEAIVFRSSRRRRPRARGRPAQPLSERRARSPRTASPSSAVQQPDTANGVRRHDAPVATMGVCGYTPGLALNPEVLDAFTDLVDDVRGVMSFGAQRLVQRLRGQSTAAPYGPLETPLPPGAAENPERAAANPVTGTNTSASAEELTGTATNAVLDITEGVSGDHRGDFHRLVASLTERTAAADTPELRLSTVLEWLDAVAAVHCSLRSSPPAEGRQAKYPALRLLCAESAAVVCERSFSVPPAVRESVTRLLGRAVLFLARDENVSEELAGCAAAAASREGCPTLPNGNDITSPAEERAPSTVGGTAVQSGSLISNISEQAEQTCSDGIGNALNPNVTGDNPANAELSANAENDDQASDKVSCPGELVAGKRHDRELSQDGDNRADLADPESEVDRRNTESNCECHTWNGLSVGVDATARTAAGGSSPGGELLKAVCRWARGPPAGSPSWLAELVARRLFYLLRPAEMHTGLAALPAGPRGRLWGCLLRGLEARSGPFLVRPADVRSALEFAAATDLDAFSLARLAAGLCRDHPAAVAASLCVQHCPRLSPLDVLYVCRYAALEPGRVAAAFSAYLAAVPASAVEPLLGDQELAEATEAALLAVWRQQAATLCCSCGRPRPGAHRVSRPAAALLRRLLAARLSGAALRRQLWTLADFSGWLAHSTVTEEPDSRADVAATLCQLDDCALLPTAASLSPDWRPLLEALSVVRSDRCCGCGAALTAVDIRPTARPARRPLTLHALLAFVISEKGAEAGLQLLQMAADVIPQQLTASCYRDVIVSTALDRKMRGVGAAFGARRLAFTPSPIPEKDVQILFSELGRPAPPPLPAPPPVSAAVTLLSADCPACCLPLRNSHLLRPHGLVTFHCQHVFHAVCLLSRGGGCLLCRR